MKKILILPLVIMTAFTFAASVPKKATPKKPAAPTALRKTAAEVKIMEDQLQNTPEEMPTSVPAPQEEVKEITPQPAATIPTDIHEQKEATKIVPNIGIAPENMKKSAALANSILADEYLLYVKTQNAHWNIIGVHFGALHCFFGQQYEQLAKIIDDTAERARMLGEYAIGTMTEFIKISTLKEEPGIYHDEKSLITALLHDHETIIRNLRTAIDTTANELKDMGTSNFFTDLIEKHEKMAWMLRSFLQ